MKNRLKVHIGWRTLKTVAAVLIAMVLAEICGTSDSKLIFAMLGAMAAMYPTFRESLYSSISQLVGVLFGGLLGIGLLQIPLPGFLQAGIGLVLVITLYNVFRIPFTPNLSCMIVVMLCITPNIRPVSYALDRCWDTTIGLAVGMLINVLVFPYDNRRRIRDLLQSLDREVIAFLEELFDEDDILPDSRTVGSKVVDLDNQLQILTNQKAILRKRDLNLEAYRKSNDQARCLATHMEVLYQMEAPGALNAENREQLAALGATVGNTRQADPTSQKDTVTNYHVARILTLRQALLESLTGSPD